MKEAPLVRSRARARSTGGPGLAIAGRFKSVTLLLRLSAHPTPPAAQICSAVSRSECARRRAPSCCSVRGTVARPVAHCHFPCCWTHGRQAQRVAVIPRALLLFRLLLSGRLPAAAPPIQLCEGRLVHHSRRMREGEREREREIGASLQRVVVLLRRHRRLGRWPSCMRPVGISM